VFVLDETKKGIPSSGVRELLSVFRSINEPKVAAAGRPAEPARAYLCEFQKGVGRVEIEVILQLRGSGIRMVYVPEEGTAATGKSQLESDALDFVEGMGFLMDNMNLAKMKPSEREGTLAALPIFEEPSEEPPIVTRGEPKDDSVSLKDLEAEFLRDDSEMAEVDSALDSLLDPKSPDSQSFPGAVVAGDGEGAGGRWRTVVRFLASF
jgi:hypothetical protein